MFLVKSALWVIVYPTVLFGYAFMSLLSWVSFLFHSPVDIWNMIGDAIERAAAEVEEE
jgi:hypothetical protein